MAEEAVKSPITQKQKNTTEPEVINLRPPPITTVAASKPSDGVVSHTDWYSWSGHMATSGAVAGDGVPPVVKEISRSRRRAESVHRATVVARVSSALLCLVSFAVLAADTDKGWTLDDYQRYKQFRFSMSVNVIGFVYSLFQVAAQIHYMMKEKHIIGWPIGGYFDFVMDQILAYLLISASSSATARTGDWVSNWGTDPFPNMANGSIAVSFLAFLAFAICALISAFNLFRQTVV